MGYKKRLLNDKTILAAAAIGVMAVTAIMGGVLIQKSPQNAVQEETMQEGKIQEGKVQEGKMQEEKIEETDEYNLNKLMENSDKIENQQGVNLADMPETTTLQNIEKNESEDEEETTENLMLMEKTNDEEKVENTIKVEEANVGVVDAKMHFDSKSVVIWPVEGNVIIDYDMENTVYFQTLDLYKCSDAVCVQSEVGTPVYAGREGIVEEIGYNTEIGNNVTLSLGDGYMMTYGQLQNVQAEAGKKVEEGDLIGYIGNPTKYYKVEGSNLYIKMTKDGLPIDPLDYLNYQ